MITLYVTLFTTGALGYGNRGCSTAWDCPEVGVYCYPGRRPGWPNHCRRGNGVGSLCDQDGDCFLSGNDRRMWCVDHKCSHGMQRLEEVSELEAASATEGEDLPSKALAMPLAERRRREHGVRKLPGCPFINIRQGEPCYYPTICKYDNDCDARCEVEDCPGGPGVMCPMKWNFECVRRLEDESEHLALKSPELQADESVEPRRQDRGNGRREYEDDRGDGRREHGVGWPWHPRCYFDWECGRFADCLHGACVEHGLLGGRRLAEDGTDVDTAELETAELAM